jgi:hypothetical protein
MRLIVAAALFSALGLFPASALAQEAPKADVWRTQKSLSGEWPRLDAGGCAEYGARYGYGECAGAEPREKPPAASAIAPAPQARRSAAAAKAPIHTQDKAAAKPAAAAPPAQAAAATQIDLTAMCAQRMTACYEACRSAGGGAQACSRSCSTHGVCGVSLNLDYAQFVDFRGYMERVMIERELFKDDPGYAARDFAQSGR